jgi:hypothetical protein
LKNEKILLKIGILTKEILPQNQLEYFLLQESKVGQPTQSGKLKKMMANYRHIIIGLLVLCAFLILSNQIENLDQRREYFFSKDK